MTIWKQLIATFLLFGILTNCFNYWVLSSSYSFNKSYISSVLCTNKTKPELHCEGKCFMDIKLKELEQKTKHDQENLKRIIETIAPTTTNLLLPVYEIDAVVFAAHYLQKKTISSAISIFHPPQLG